MSQLSLAHMADMSPRHLSFLETGRSRPGKDLIFELAQVLRLSYRDTNTLMYAAGLPPPYVEGQFSTSQDLSPFRRLIDSLVHGNPRHPCCVVDRFWRIQDASHSLRLLWRKIGWHFSIPDDLDVIDRILAEGSDTPNFLNRDEVARQFVLRLRSELSLEDPDEEIERLAEKVEAKIGLTADSANTDVHDLPLTLSARYQIDDEVYSAVVGISRFGGSRHVELSELRMIWFISADAESERLLDRLVAGAKDAA